MQGGANAEELKAVQDLQASIELQRQQNLQTMQSLRSLQDRQMLQQDFDLQAQIQSTLGSAPHLSIGGSASSGYGGVDMMNQGGAMRRSGERAPRRETPYYGEQGHPARPKAGGRDRAKLFVGGLGTIGLDELDNYFSRFGHIVDSVVMKDGQGQPRGFGFVSFDNFDALDNALQSSEHIIAGKTVTVKEADGRR